jgi:dUTP pyrophosphatase
MPTRVQVAVQRLDTELPLAAYAREGNAGLHLHAAETVTLPPGGCALVGTGIALAIPGGASGRAGDQARQCGLPGIWARRQHGPGTR